MFNSVFCAAGNGQCRSTRCARAGKVTLVYFWANWCGPCRQVTPALEQMAAANADIGLRKIDLSDGGREGGFEEAAKYNIEALPHVKVYNRGGGLVGSVTGADIDKVKS